MRATPSERGQKGVPAIGESGASISRNKTPTHTRAAGRRVGHKPVKEHVVGDGVIRLVGIAAARSLIHQLSPFNQFSDTPPAGIKRWRSKTILTSDSTIAGTPLPKIFVSDSQTKCNKLSRSLSSRGINITPVNKRIETSSIRPSLVRVDIAGKLKPSKKENI